MSDSMASLQRKMHSAGELESVVRTMKAMAALNIGQYERAVSSLDVYYRTVQLGLAVCFRRGAVLEIESMRRAKAESAGAIVLGSDQGLVGQFNDELVDFAMQQLRDLAGEKTVWAIGERVQSRLLEQGFASATLFIVPDSINAITVLVGQILSAIEAWQAANARMPVYIFHNQPRSGALYEPVSQRLLPLDATWREELLALPWPDRNLPEVVGSDAATLSALIREYLFVSLFRACAESLASENASRLAAMQRAEKNIDELLTGFKRMFYHLRQSGIDEELFDVIAGFEALTTLQVRQKGS